MNENLIDKIRDIIVETYHPDKVILFGSFARGDNKPGSDVDLLIISDREKNLPVYKRGLDMRLKLAEIPVEKDIVIYAQGELDKWKDVPTAFTSRVIKEGRILYER